MQDTNMSLARTARARSRFAEMTLATTCAILLVIASSWLVTPSGAAAADLEEDTDVLLTTMGARGASVVEVSAKGTFAEVDRGVTGTGESVGTSSMFVWGSVSKPISALLVRQLEAKGLVDPGQPVSRYLPELLGSELDERGLMVNDLVDHTSGLPHDLTLTDLWDRRTPARKSLAGVTAITDLGPRGEFRYSSLNYLVLQAVVEAVHPTTYGDTLEEFVVSATGATGVVATPEAFLAAVPPGFVPFFWGEQEVSTGVDSAGFGYGYLAGRPVDLARIASFLMTDRRVGLAEIDRVVGEGIPSGGGVLHADGWNVERVEIDGKPRTLFSHSGAVPGYYSHVALVPEEDRAFVILTNRYGEVEAEQYAEASKAFVLRRLGQDDSSAEPSALHRTVLATMAVPILALLVLTLWQVKTTLGRSAIRRPYRRVLTRCVFVAGVGFASVAAVVVVPETLLDISPRSAMPWAPDIVLLVWLLLGQILLACALYIVREASAFSKRATPLD